MTRKNQGDLPRKFRNKYRIPSTRLPGYDYSSNGAYFVTICTKNRKPFFGKIAYKNMQLSKIGEIIREELLKTLEIRKNVQLGAWAIMPNHIHIIFILHNENPVQTPRRGVSTQWKSGCLGAIINQFKSKCTKRIREFYPDFSWQSRFHEHIIRNEAEFERISKYIHLNPHNWKEDCFY